MISCSHFNHSSSQDKRLLCEGSNIMWSDQREDIQCSWLSEKYSTRHLLCTKTPLKHMVFWCTINDAYCRRLRGARVDVTFAGLHDSSLRHCSSSLVKTSERKPSVPVQNESMRLYITPSSLVTSTQLLQYWGHVTQLLAGSAELP